MNNKKITEELCFYRDDYIIELIEKNLKKSIGKNGNQKLIKLIIEN